jgi:hypothetical protein
MHIPSPPLNRRAFLRGAGITLALPFLEAMQPAFGAQAGTAIPRRMVCIQTNMGILPQFFFPETAGRDFAPSAYLDRLKTHRDQITVFSGVSYPGVDGGHTAQKCFLTGTPHPARGGFRNGISLDQFAAEEIGNQTRHPSLVLAVTNENATMSFTRNGAPIPSEQSPMKLFGRLFIQGNNKEVAANVEALQRGRSLLDFVSDESKRLGRTLSKNDQGRLDQYYTAVRELEQRLHSAEEWEYKPKPAVNAKAPSEITDAKEFVRRTEQTFEVMKLALETDSTRVISLFIDTTVIHNITHHGNREEVLGELRGHEERQFDALNGFLNALRGTQEQGDSLLDRTQILYGTCMGSANSHSNVNLPVLLAGGGFKHGQHLAFDKVNNHPLTNLHVSMLQRLGLQTGEFSTGKSTMRGLEMA